MVNKSEATAEIFLTAFKALSKKERDAIVVKMVEDENLRRDLFDIALAQERAKEPTRPLKDVLAEIGDSKRR